VRVCVCVLYILIKKKVTTSDYTDYNRLHDIQKGSFFESLLQKPSDYK
jgi:hypothetical protein